MGLLTNVEVLEVNQDPLGRQADRIVEGEGYQVWAKEMEDGSIAVGLFNLDAYDHKTVRVDLGTLGLAGGSLRVRDLWRQKDLGTFDGHFEAEVAPHGVVLIRIFQK